MDYLKINKPLVRPLCLTAGILGIIQSTGWIIFNILAIFYYFAVIDVPEKLPALPHYIYYIYLDKDRVITSESKELVGPKDFMAFMFTYLILNIIWLVVSSFLLFFMVRDKWSEAYKFIIGWSATVISILIVDAVLGGLLAHDYDYYKNLDNFNVDLLDAIGVVMSMAFKGYVLWVVDFIFFGILVKFAGNLYKEQKQGVLQDRIILAFDQDLYGSSKTENDTDPYGLDRYNRVGVDSAEQEHAFENNFYNSINNGDIRVATIGRSKKIPSPPIPPPDYTPPGSPRSKIRSVLKLESSYN